MAIKDLNTGDSRDSERNLAYRHRRVHLQLIGRMDGPIHTRARWCATVVVKRRGGPVVVVRLYEVWIRFTQPVNNFH